MQIDKINNYSMSFQSKFVPNKYLAAAFDNAAGKNNRIFLNSVKTILKDGKDDTLEVVKSNSNYKLLVNGEVYEEALSNSYYENPAILAITKYAQKLFDSNIMSSSYQNLSEKERALIKDEVYMIKLFTDSFVIRKNYIEDIQNQLNKIKRIINDNTKKEIEDLKKIIFDK